MSSMIISALQYVFGKRGILMLCLDNAGLVARFSKLRGNIPNYDIFLDSSFCEVDYNF
jgi:hypothetical protein